MILLAGIIEGIQPRKDKSIKITFGANEDADKQKNTENLTKLFDAYQKFCYLVIKEEEFASAELEAITNLKYDGKIIGRSMAEKMRDMMWHVWNKSQNPFATFDDYYVWRMNKMIDELSDELSKLNV